MPSDASDLYQDLMRFKPEGMTPNRWASLAGVSRTVWSDMRRHGNPARRTLEKLLAAAGSSLAEFEALRVGIAPVPTAESGSGVTDRVAPAWRGASPPPLRLFAARAAPSPDQPSRIAVAADPSSEIVARPSGLVDRAAFAIPVVEESMWPRFRLGRRLIVSPGSQPAPGDDVLVRLVDHGHALVKELVRVTGAEVELRQFHPAATIVVDTAEIADIARILGEAI